MKKLLLSAIFGASALLSFGQYQEISIHDLQFVSPQDLQNCNDTSAYFGDTIIIVGTAIHDGGLAELASGSVTGGYRPSIWLVDTANNSAMAPWSAVQIHGVFDGSNPVNELDNISAGWTIKLAGSVSRFDGETQFNPLNNTVGTIATGAAIEIISTNGAAPAPVAVNLGDLNDANRENQLETGEQWEGAYVELTNLTVTAVNFFSGGSRVSFDVVDANGNAMNVSDRFIAQKLPSWSALNASSPQTTGLFSAPPVGAQFDTLRGIVIHSENGCTGSNGRGYELNPFDSNDYVFGATPPNITNEARSPFIPTPSQAATVTANITDFDGTVTSATLSYSTNNGTSFTDVTMSLVGGTTDEYTADIPAQTEGTVVLYFIEAEDNDNNTSTVPGTANTYRMYTVRENGPTIVDVQRPFDANANDNSPYLGDTVTVTGIVTASSKANDLGYVYIQQEGETEWAGISLQGNSELIGLFRTEEVVVTGVVQENFGFTFLQVTELNKTGEVKDITPVYMDPSDAVLHTDRNLEKFESMLIGLANPSGNPMEIVDEDRGFGEYTLGTDVTATVETRVLAGRQSNNASSSLNVSLISDAQYETTDGEIEVDSIVITAQGMKLDTLYGIMYYSFSNYKMLPRNNTDLVGLTQNDGTPIVIDSTVVELPDTTTGVIEIAGQYIDVVMFPNPAQSQVNVSFEQTIDATIEVVDMAGRTIITQVVNGTQVTVGTEALQQGLYLVRIADAKGKTLTVERLMIQR